MVSNNQCKTTSQRVRIKLPIFHHGNFKNKNKNKNKIYYLFKLVKTFKTTLPAAAFQFAIGLILIHLLKEQDIRAWMFLLTRFSNVIIL